LVFRPGRFLKTENPPPKWGWVQIIPNQHLMRHELPVPNYKVVPGARVYCT
jgi:hypothetical protein